MSHVYLKNKTSSAITVAGYSVYYIDKTDAEIVEVKNSSHVKYNAFKYSLSGVLYWYVIDGVQENWTDDLSSIGYSEVVPLPKVSFGGDFDASNWLYATNDHTSSTIPSNSVLDLWVSTGGSHVKATYDSSKSYSAWKWYSDYSTTESNGAISISNNNGYVAAKNETNSNVTFKALDFHSISQFRAACGLMKMARLVGSVTTQIPQILLIGISLHQMFK